MYSDICLICWKRCRKLITSIKMIQVFWIHICHGPGNSRNTVEFRKRWNDLLWKYYHSRSFFTIRFLLHRLRKNSRGIYAGAGTDGTSILKKSGKWQPVAHFVATPLPDFVADLPCLAVFMCASNEPSGYACTSIWRLPRQREWSRKHNSGWAGKGWFSEMRGIRDGWSWVQSGPEKIKNKNGHGF